MPLHKIADFYQNYQDEIFAGRDVKGLPIYTEDNQKVGTINDLLVDQEGKFRYLVLDTGFWIFGKQVLLPAGLLRIHPQQQRIYLRSLNKQQAEDLPEYYENMTVDFTYEEQVRQVYRVASLEDSAPLESAAPLSTAEPLATHGDRRNTPLDPISHNSLAQPVVPPDPMRDTGLPVPLSIQRDIDSVSERVGVSEQKYSVEANSLGDRPYSYEQEPALYALNDQDHSTFKLYEERLTAVKRREKTGEVIFSKRVETQTTRITVPLEKERVVFRRYAGGQQGQLVESSETAFQAGEIARFEVYEETADIRKQPMVRESVRIHKEIERDTTEVEEQVRREALEVETTGNPELVSSSVVDSVDSSRE